MSRTYLVAGNWKMHGSLAMTAELIAGIRDGLTAAPKVEALVCPPYPYLAAAAQAIGGSPLALGAQNLADQDKQGAYTGEVLGSMLVELGCRYVIVGHSERRTYHHEDDGLVAAKAAAAFRHGLTPIVCIGEHLDVREAGSHVEHNINQLRGSLAGLTDEQLTTVVIAYEPVWAIGTGRVASAGDAQEVCAAIRTELAALASPQIAAGVRVLYGGSVNAKNVGEIVAQPDVDGALVGGASLEGEQFATLSAIAAGGPLP